MKKNLLLLAGAAAIALGLASCAYDPYYSGSSRTAVNVGYGHGYGYGGDSFSTSFFWSTGSDRWGYDPHVRSYYDYNRRAYYDPYLSGYYPLGYRPPVLVGVPHPSGYRHGWCPPPRRITRVTINNYRNREAAYRNTDHRWADDVRIDRRHHTSASPSRSRDVERSRTYGSSRNHNDSSNVRDRRSSSRRGGYANTDTGSPSWLGGSRNTSIPRTRTSSRRERNVAPAPSESSRSIAPPRSIGRGVPDRSTIQGLNRPTGRPSTSTSRGNRQVQPPARSNSHARGNSGTPQRSRGVQTAPSRPQPSARPQPSGPSRSASRPQPGQRRENPGRTRR